MQTSLSDFVRAECAVFPEELEYAQWLVQVRAKLGMKVSENGIAWDLFADEATPDEAADEIKALGIQVFAFLIEYAIQAKHVYVQAESVEAAADFVADHFSNIQPERRTFVGTRIDCYPDFVA